MLKTFLGLFKSKTFYFNLAVAAVGVLTDTVKDNPELSLLVTAGGNMLLRLLTKVPLSQK